MITRMLLASVLAIGAGSFAAGCGDTDCPSSAANGVSCSSEGLSCTPVGGAECTCTKGTWACAHEDLQPPVLHDLSMRDLANPHD